MPNLSRLEEQARRRLVRIQLKHEQAIQVVLRDALNDMRRDMQRIYNRWAINGILTKAEMTKANRLVTAERTLLADLNPALRKNLITIDRLRPTMYNASYFNYAWTVDTGGGIRLAWGIPTKASTAEALASSFYRISTDTYGPRARATVREHISKGLIRGKSFPQMSDDLAEAMDITAGRAMRIARTEGGFAQSAGQAATYDTAAVEGVKGERRWLATLDGRTRPDHGTMDGRARGGDGLYHMPDGSKGPYPKAEGLSAGERINCRCDEIFVIEGYEPQLRRTRSEGLVPAQNFEQWSDPAQRRTF